MPNKYVGLGMSLLYPESWSLAEDELGQSIELETPSGAFLTITCCQDLQAAFLQAEQTMQAEYDEIEVEPISTVLAGIELSGSVQRFVYLDLIVASRLLKLHAGDKKYLIQIQGVDSELDALQLVFDAILTSMCQSLAAS